MSSAARPSEADVYPKFSPELSPFLTGNLGELSLFHETHGYWVDGVAPTTATLPAGWESRLVKVCNDNTAGAVGWCLDPHDIAFSKLAARREKDLAFVAELVRHRMIRPSVVEELIGGVGDADLRARLVEAWAMVPPEGRPDRREGLRCRLTSSPRGNRARDRKVNRALRDAGWRVVRIWEHELSERGIRNAERGTRKSEVGRRSAERGTLKTERGTRSAERGTARIRKALTAASQG